MLGVIESVDVVSRFCQQVSVPPLTARDIEYPRARRQSQDVDHSSDFVTVALEREDRLVFEQIVRVEIRLPPFAFPAQKKTGSR
jgi:hypothetical protein